MCYDYIAWDTVLQKLKETWLQDDTLNLKTSINHDSRQILENITRLKFNTGVRDHELKRLSRGGKSASFRAKGVPITVTSQWARLRLKSPASRLFTQRVSMRRSNKTSKLRVTGLCAGNSPVTGEFPTQMASNAENVSIWWRHHARWRVHDRGQLLPVQDYRVSLPDFAFLK